MVTLSLPHIARKRTMQAARIRCVEGAVKKIAKLTPLLFFLLAAMPASAAEAPTSWLKAVARMIAENQTYPRSAQIKGEEGTTSLRITLGADGKINGVDVAASSGSPILDRQAQSVISRIGRFPPPPAGVSSFLVPIVWRIN